MGPRFDPLPALAAERRKLRVGTRSTEVTADLRQLVRRDEDPVITSIRKREVVARDPRERLGVKPREPGDAVVLVNDQVPGLQLAEGGQRPPCGRGRRGAAAMDEAAVGEDDQLQLR